MTDLCHYPPQFPSLISIFTNTIPRTSRRNSHIPSPALPPRPAPCQPNPCGPNSECRPSADDKPICSCQPGFFGSPCRPECTINPDCPMTRACINYKCVDPCQGSCGINAQCSVVAHNPVCRCPDGLTGDPFSRCFEKGKCCSCRSPLVLLTVLSFAGFQVFTDFLNLREFTNGRCAVFFVCLFFASFVNDCHVYHPLHALFSM